MKFVLKLRGNVFFGKKKKLEKEDIEYKFINCL